MPRRLITAHPQFHPDIFAAAGARKKDLAAFMGLVIIFFLLIFCALYAYFGYAVLLTAIGRGRPLREPPADLAEDELPTVALLIAAYNEEAIIARKIRNALDLDYPAGKLSVVVVSDGSTDGTDSMVESYRDRGVTLLRVEGRQGKTVARNRAVANAEAEIVVMSDANGMYKPDALRKLARHFADEKVGAVCGNLTLTGEGGRENLYWQYEKWIKRFEDRTHSIIGANGSIYAIRRSLYEEIPPEVDDDFIEPLLAYRKGYALRYEDEAVSVEEDIAEHNVAAEFQAKKRVVLRGIQSLSYVSGLLNPFRYPMLSLELISHKIFKWLVPFCLIAIFVVNFFLPRHPFFVFTFIIQLAFYCSAFIGITSGCRELYVPAFLVLTNAAILMAVCEFFVGRRNRTWDRTRGGATEDDS
ncbi:MAG: glycosyltransferase family 2 protein [bacterium]|nr:MAG: glycosyltransferase family 2 protein [bacterium]